MSIINIQRVSVGQVGVTPGLVKMATTDDLSTITTEGYLGNQTAAGQLSPTDIIEAIYDFDDVSGTFGLFSVSVSDGVNTLEEITLVADESITTAKLADGAVTEDKIDDDAVTTDKIEDDAVTTPKIDDAAVTLAKLATGISPSHVVKFSGTHSYAGGGTTTAATVAGVAATDKVVATLTGATTLVPFKAVLTTNTITFTFSADPGAGTTIDYAVLRAAA